MTAEEARQHIGEDVIYQRCCNPHPEHGTITSVRGQWVFVRYGWENTSKATSPGDLTLATQP